MLKAIMNKCMKECDKRGASTIVFPAIGTGNLGFPIDTAANIMVGEVCDYLQKNKCKSLSMVYFIIFMENMYRTFHDKLEMRKKAELVPTKTVTRTQPKNKRSQEYRGHGYDTHKYIYDERAAKPSDGHTLDLSNGIRIDVVKGDITQEETDVIVNTTDDQMSLGGGVGAALARQGGRLFEEACRKVKTSKKKGLREGKVIETKAGNLNCKCVFHIMFQKHNFVEVVSACIEIACKNQFRSIAFPAIGTGTERFPIDEAAKGMMKGLEKSRPSFNMSVRIVVKEEVHSKFIAAISSQPSWLQRASKTLGTLGSLVPSWGHSTSANDSDEEPMEICESVDIELRIYGETSESVKSAEASIHQLINRQFNNAETIHDDRISLLQPSEEKFLRSEAHRKQIMFHMDRNLNTIELKGSKEHLCEMNFQIQVTLSKLMTIRRAQAETMMKTVQWRRQDTPYDLLTNLEIEEKYHTSEGRSNYTFKDVKSGGNFTIDFPRMVEIDHAIGKEYKVRRIIIGK